MPSLRGGVRGTRFTGGLHESHRPIRPAKRDGLVPVTTEKDMARLAGDNAAAELKAAARPLPVRLVVTEDGEFRKLVLSAAAAA